MGLGTRAALCAACAILLVAAWGSGVAQGADWRQCPGWNLEPSAASASASVVSVVCLINAERAQYGLVPLRWNWRLWCAAQRMANDMVSQSFFSHEEPDGRGLLARVAATGYLPQRSDNWAIGENLGWGEGMKGSPIGMVFGWMTSPGHRANVLASDYREIGIGYVLGSPIAGRTSGAVIVAEFGHAGP